MAIYLKKNTTLTRLSVNFNGIWSFATPTNRVRQDEGVSYYKIDYPFGVTNSQEKNPQKIQQVGTAGDYLVLDTLGTYSIVSKKKYDILFPPSINYHTAPPPLSSEALKDPNFLTKIAEGTDNLEYNSTQRSASTRPTSTY